MIRIYLLKYILHIAHTLRSLLCCLSEKYDTALEASRRQHKTKYEQGRDEGRMNSVYHDYTFDYSFPGYQNTMEHLHSFDILFPIHNNKTVARIASQSVSLPTNQGKGNRWVVVGRKDKAGIKCERLWNVGNRKKYVRNGKMLGMYNTRDTSSGVWCEIKQKYGMI